MEAIQSGTIRAAEVLGWGDKLGTIEPGKWADLVTVSGDPLKDNRGIATCEVRDEGWRGL